MDLWPVNSLPQPGLYSYVCAWEVHAAFLGGQGDSVNLGFDSGQGNRTGWRTGWVRIQAAPASGCSGRASSRGRPRRAGFDPLERHEAIFEQHGNRYEPVPPADLFAAGDATRVVLHGDLPDCVAQAQQLGRDLGFEVEAVRLDAKARQDLGAAAFVTGLHVGDHGPVEQVGESREGPVGPIGRGGGPGPTRQEPRAVYDVGLPIEHGGDHLQDLLRVELEIGILNDDD